MLAEYDHQRGVLCPAMFTAFGAVGLLVDHLEAIAESLFQIDTVRCHGVVSPFTNKGFPSLVENHYRYYQFYANMLVSGTAAYAVQVVLHGNLCQANWSTLGFILLELVFLAGSRDALRKYYSLRVEDGKSE